MRGARGKESDPTSSYELLAGSDVYQRELANAAVSIGVRKPRLEQPMPERLIRHLETLERMAKTASHTMEFLRKTAVVALLLCVIFAVLRVGNASSQSYEASRDSLMAEAEKSREIAAAIRKTSERIENLKDDGKQTRDLMRQLLQEVRKERE